MSTSDIIRTGSGELVGDPDVSPRSPLTVLGRDSVYVVVGFPLAIASFVMAVTGIALSIGLAPIWIGLPIGVGTLLTTRVFASVERERLEARGLGRVDGVYRRPRQSDTRIRRALTVARDPQSWLDTLYAVIILPISTITFSIVVSWWAGGLGGITYWLWGRSLPDDDDNETLADLLHLDMSDSLFSGLLGVALLATLIPVTWACASVQASLSRVLLGNRHAAALSTGSGEHQHVDRVDPLDAMDRGDRGTIA